MHFFMKLFFIKEEVIYRNIIFLVELIVVPTSSREVSNTQMSSIYVFNYNVHNRILT